MRTQTDITRKNAEVDLSIREQVSLAEIETKRAELKLRQAQAEADAYRARVMADAEAEAAKVRLAEQARTAAVVTAAFGYALSGVLVLAALAAVIWTTGYSYSRARVAVLSSGLVRIGVEPSTLLPPPLVITADGILLDTRTGARAALKDAAGIERLKLAATTRLTETALLARAATDIGKATKDKQAADMLPGIAASVPTLAGGEHEPQNV
jgi:hypothetical protein